MRLPVNYYPMMSRIIRLGVSQNHRVCTLRKKSFYVIEGKYFSRKQNSDYRNGTNTIPLAALKGDRMTRVRRERYCL